jgi:hypothetical protein
LLDCPRKDDERTWLAVRALLLAVALMAGTWHPAPLRRDRIHLIAVE